MAGLAQISVWIGEVGKNYGVSERTWFVTIYDHDDKPLQWNGRTFALIPAPHGRMTVAIPPGCYRISAVWSYYLLGNIFYGNHFTDSTLVVLCCNEIRCVKLYVPLLHKCGIVFGQAALDLAKQLNFRIALNPPADELAQLQAIKTALDPLLDVVPIIDNAVTAVARLGGTAALTDPVALKEEVTTDEANVREMEKFLIRAQSMSGDFKFTGTASAM